MQELNIKGVDITREIGASSATISKWKSGKASPAQYIVSLAKLLQTTPKWIMEGQFEDNSEEGENKQKIVRLIEERVRKNLSQEMLAQSIKMSIAEIRAYEYGDKSLSIDFLNALSRLNFDLNYILSGNRTQTPEQTSAGLSHQTGNIVNGSIGDGAVNVQGGSFKK